MLKGIPKITSKENPLIKHLVKIRENRQYRQANQTAVVSGLTLIREIALSQTPKTILMSEEIESPEIIKCPKIYKAPVEILKKISGQPAPDGYIAEFSLPPAIELMQKKYVLALDGIADPGNLGTLIRTALAFGWEGVFLLPGCVDPFHEKSIGASRGGVFRLPYQIGSWSTLKTCVEINHLTVFSAHLNGQKLHTIKPPSHVLIILSHETRGLSKEGATLGQKVTIPIHRQEMESLNVSVAGGILLYHFKNPI